MKSIYFDAARLKTYSAVTREGKSTIRVVIETADHFELSDILRQLDAITVQQKLAAQTERSAKKTNKQLALPAPALALPYYGDDT